MEQRQWPLWRRLRHTGVVLAAVAVLLVLRDFNAIGFISSAADAGDLARDRSDACHRGRPRRWFGTGRCASVALAVRPVRDRLARHRGQYGDITLMDWHMRLGYAAIGLLLFRVGWALWGASLRALARPSACRRRASSRVPSRREHALGAYGARGALLALAMHRGGGGAGGHGSVHHGRHLHQRAAGAARSAGHRRDVLSSMHRQLFWVVIVLIGVHLAAHLIYGLLRNPTPLGMFTGRKPFDGDPDAGHLAARGCSPRRRRRARCGGRWRVGLDRSRLDRLTTWLCRASVAVVVVAAAAGLGEAFWKAGMTPSPFSTALRKPAAAREVGHRWREVFRVVPDRRAGIAALGSLRETGCGQSPTGSAMASTCRGSWS
jgi:cytochrome b